MSVAHESAVYQVPSPGPWAKRGACVGRVPAAAFFLFGPDDIEAAKAVCRGCVVVDDCRSYALAHPEISGVWGATSDEDRHRLRPGAQAEPAPRALPDRGELSLRSQLERQMAYPGRWVWVRNYLGRTSAGAMASDLRAGQRLIPPGEWEFEGRTSANGSDLYARYLGPLEESEAS